MFDELLVKMLMNNVSHLEEEMALNNKKIMQLQSVHGEISLEQEELMNHANLVNNPQLSSESWAGKYATEFSENRSKLEHAFKEIGNNQVEKVLQTIETKITYLQNQNRSLGDSISSVNNRITQLNIEKE
ncbi:DUF5082 family protein [Priestia megaterium]|jgi:hypothetical protein|uniref:YwqH-like family protein n=1 Tax=Priestia megaterium TaxID=1404 RepID=UPI00064C956C|nr:DUF5082 family protein [Priestia megaterium]KLV31905.1 hypothetical protein ABW04_11600 [Priestia megaterium]MCE4089399.1 DUF5082 domain-containing protein [Priestia megaterium]MDN4634553.1 DUF5082 family protein [Sphingomonas sp. PsM26]